MALIACPDCGKPVSDQAASCPSCGRPLGGRPGGGATVIEQTAKRWKKVQAVGAVGMVLGLLSLFLIGRVVAGMPEEDYYYFAAPALIGLGLVVHLAGRFGAWWHHG